jgi:hypothetical protein
MWYSSFIDRYDERRAAEDDDHKLTEPSAVGASLAFPKALENASLTDLAGHVMKQRAQSAEFFSSGPSQAIDYVLKDDVLSFKSDILTETNSNNIVQARLYEARKSRGAIIILPHWNASMWDYHAFSKHLRRLGYTTVELILPYHGSRNRSDGTIADYFLSANIGRTIRSVRQAVLDTRRVIDWLDQRKSGKIGLIGISLGSCIAGLVAAHDPRISMSALLLTAGDFAEVVWTGRATRHIQAVLAAGITMDQLQVVWSIISTESYVSQLARETHRSLIISGSRDKVVLPNLTRRFVDQIRGCGGSCAWRVLACGHYSVGLFPFNLMAFLSLVTFFRRGGL